jgi:hypothetical protein
LAMKSGNNLGKNRFGDRHPQLYRFQSGNRSLSPEQANPRPPATSQTPPSP